MKKEDKKIVVENIVSTINSYSHFYLVSVEGMNADSTTNLRRTCFNKDIKLMVVKNTLLREALKTLDADYSTIYEALKGSTAIMFSNAGNVPAKLLKSMEKAGVPTLKAAYVEESVYVGANQLDALCAIKSKNEVIADVIALLQSPAKNVVSALQSGGNTIHGVLKTLAEK